MAEFLGGLEEAVGSDEELDAAAVEATAAVAREQAQPRHVGASALAAAMLPPESSPLLQQLEEEASGLEHGYFRVVHPARSTFTRDPELVRFSASVGLLAELGLPLEISAADLLACFGTWEARPMPRVSMAYMGWQFGVLNKGLGDGRAFTWGQWRWLGGEGYGEIGTKGSGKTPFSRGHDGLLTLEGAVREALAAEALGAAGLRTSRILAVIESEGPPSVLRGVPAVAEPGAVLVSPQAVSSVA